MIPDPSTVLAHGVAARYAEEVLDAGDGSLACRGRIPAHSPAVTDGAAGTWVVLELAAQAAALLQAAGGADGDASEGAGETVGGYLVRIKNARFAQPTVPADTALVARVERTGGAGPLSLFTARVELDGRTIATADLATFANR